MPIAPEEKGGREEKRRRKTLTPALSRKREREEERKEGRKEGREEGREGYEKNAPGFDPRSILSPHPLPSLAVDWRIPTQRLASTPSRQSHLGSPKTNPS